jgi:cytochrome b
MTEHRKVWDPFVRAGHWLLAAAFVTAYITGEEWQGIHIYAGYTVFGVVAFRLLWGLVGTRPARFTSFLAPLSRVKAHLHAVGRLEAPAYPGHNPAGGWAVVILLTLLLHTTLAGRATLAGGGGGTPGGHRLARAPGGGGVGGGP